MTAVIRAKNFRKTQRYVKVMGRLADPKRRKQIAKEFERRHGKPMQEPDAFQFYVGFPIEHYGFEGAFEACDSYIESQEAIHRKAFEWKIAGGEW